MEFHEKLQKLRKQKGITQEKLAEALYVSRTAVSKWESGRGYPGIDSLKRIAEFYGVTVDVLLSGDEVLSIAKADQQQKEGRFLDLVFGLTDVSAMLFFVLPLFAKAADGGVAAVSLLALTGIAVYLKLAYFALALGLMGMGILTLALQNCKGAFWIRWKYGLSLTLGGVGAMLFSIGRQPYAAVFLCLFLILKALLLLKKG